MADWTEQDLPDDRVIAHRGGAHLAPENTLTAFRRAAAAGVRWVETDVCLLGDGIPILFHDPDFERCTGVPGRVRDSTWADVRSLDVGAGFGVIDSGASVPRLDKALPMLAAMGLGLNLELKLHGDERESLIDAVLPCLDRLWPASAGLLVSSFDRQSLALMRQARPRMRLGLICRAIPTDWQALGEALGLISFHLDYRALEREAVEALTDADYALYCYTPNTLAEATRLWAWGVTGVITDNPAALL